MTLVAGSRRGERTVHVARIKTVLDEHLCNLGPALEASAVHRSVAVLFRNGDVGSSREQSLDSVELAHQHRVHEWRLTARTLAVERGASPDECVRRGHSESVGCVRVAWLACGRCVVEGTHSSAFWISSGESLATAAKMSAAVAGARRRASTESGLLRMVSA